MAEKSYIPYRRHDTVRRNRIDWQWWLSWVTVFIIAPFGAFVLAGLYGYAVSEGHAASSSDRDSSKGLIPLVVGFAPAFVVDTALDTVIPSDPHFIRWYTTFALYPLYGVVMIVAQRRRITGRMLVILLLFHASCCLIVYLMMVHHMWPAAVRLRP